MTDPTVRDAAPGDIPALHALIESAYRGEVSRAGWTTEADLLAGQRTDPEELDDILADPEQAMLTAWDGDDLLACIRIQRQPDGAGYFGMLSVSPTRQASGLGRRMVAAAEDTLAQRFGARLIRISVFPQRDTLIAWYERLGYADTGRTLDFDYGNLRLGVALRDDLYFVVMEKTLT
ncbi:MAG: GNAT family N-acetyltransferase [Alphaproteobacteria bacterium]|nr:GNAT family N-acetyltransferase [Alphaproteobacteria bacterium]MBU2380204.1 GNAT family N-acetyltransferase [Alphaproteobacteria bacterium]